MRYNHLDIVHLGEGIYTIKNTVNQKYVKLGKRETRYLLECVGYDGSEMVIADVQELDQTEKAFMYEKFEEWGFLNEEASEQEAVKKLDITRIKICELNPDTYLKKIPRGIKELFSLKGVFLVMGLTILGIYLMFQNPDALYRAAKDSFHFSIKQYMIFYFMMIVTTMVHEMGHAICCSRHGGKISSMGLMLFFLIPCFFCDVSDIYLFKDRKKSFSVAVSGIMVNYTMGTIGCILFFVLAQRNIYVPLLMFYYFANIGFVVFNLIPFVKLDGYWVTAALLEVDNLMDKSILTFLTGILRPGELKEICCCKVKKLMLFLYGFSAIVFRPVFWVISVYSVCGYLNEKGLDYMRGIVVGFVLVMVVKDISNLLVRYIDMYRNQKQRVLRMI